MPWSENLFNNLIVAFVLIAIFTIVYCKVQKKTIGDIIKDLKEGMSSE